jgi:hypothetical protein
MTGKVLALAFGVMLAGFASVSAAEETPVFRDPATLGLGGKRIVLRGTDAGGHAQRR